MSFSLIFWVLYILLHIVVEIVKAAREENRKQKTKNQRKSLLKLYKEAFGDDFEFAKIFLQNLNRISGPFTHVIRVLHSKHCIDSLRAVKYWVDKKAINSIEDWNPEPNKNAPAYILDLAQFLFESYEVPYAVRYNWINWGFGYDRNESNPSIPETWFFDFYFHLAEGKSVRSADYLPVKFSRKAAHWLSKSPGFHEFTKVYWWCTFRAFGGDEERATHIAGMELNYENRKFWISLLQMVAQSDAKIWSSDEVALLIKYIQLVKFGEGSLSHYEKLKSVSGSIPNYTLRGKTLKSMLQFLEIKASPNYPEVEGIDDNHTISHSGNTFLIMRLKNRRALIEEGRSMGHCVGGEDYHECCLAGTSSIWSLRQIFENGEFKRLVTIELEGKSVTEFEDCSGEYPTGENLAVIGRWTSHFKIKWSPELTECA